MVLPWLHSYQDEEEVREEVFHQQLACYISKEYIHLLGMYFVLYCCSCHTCLLATEVACLLSVDSSVVRPRQQPEGMSGDVVMDETEGTSQENTSHLLSSCYTLTPLAVMMAQDEVRQRDTPACVTIGSCVRGIPLLGSCVSGVPLLV